MMCALFVTVSRQTTYPQEYPTVPAGTCTAAMAAAARTARASSREGGWLRAPTARAGWLVGRLRIALHCIAARAAIAFELKFAFARGRVLAHDRPPAGTEARRVTCASDQATSCAHAAGRPLSS